MSGRVKRWWNDLVAIVGFFAVAHKVGTRIGQGRPIEPMPPRRPNPHKEGTR